MDENHSGLPHGGSVLRSGVTGMQGEFNNTVEFSLNLESNPFFTGSVLTAVARAAYRLNKDGETGGRTIFDIPPYYLCETRYWYHGNGKIVLFFRPDKYNPKYAYDRFKGSEIMEKAIPLSTENYFYSAVSYDYGETWDIPRKTDFYCDISLTATGRLPDGRFYYVGNEDGDRLYQRDPLVLSLSDDGENFDKHYILAHGGYKERFRGINKGGAFAYPNVIQVGDYLYVSFTIYKEEIAVARIALADLK
jgi:hypothetical protein